jgi:hypothetical protein
MYRDPYKTIKTETDLLKLGQTLYSSFYSLYTEFIRIVRLFNYDNKKLKGVLISKLNKKYFISISTFFELLYNKLIKKLYTINKIYELQYISRENRKHLNANQPPVSSGRPLDKTNTGQTTASTTITTLRTDRTPIRTRAEYDAL